MNYIVIVILIIVLGMSVYKKVDIIKEFTVGATEGMKTTIKLVPILVFVITVISVFRASGATDIIENLIAPIVSFVKIPKETLPLMILRPISGSASLAMLTGIVSKYGADSYIGRVACTMSSSTETTLYAVSVYSGAAKINNTGKILISGVLADVFSAICAVFFVHCFF
ncbi:MAG: spore maturation protein [Clostridia bacterium]